MECLLDNKIFIFFGAKYLPLGFDLKIVVKLTENVLFEELPWQPIWYYRRCYHHHPFFQLSSSVISTVFLFRFGQMTRGEDATACFESSLFVLSCNVIKKGLFLHRFALCCVTSRRRWRDTFDFNQLLPFTATILSLYFSHKLKTFSTSLSSRQGTRNGLGYNRSISFFSFVVSF